MGFTAAAFSTIPNFKPYSTAKLAENTNDTKMLKSYQLVLGIALAFACFNVETSPISSNFNAIHRRPNATQVRPAVNYQPSMAFNNTRPYPGVYNNSRFVQSAQSYPQHAVVHYQAPQPQRPNIGFHNNIFSSQPIHGVFPNGSAYANHTQGNRQNSTRTLSYLRRLKFW